MKFNFGRKVKRMARRQMRRGKLDRDTYNKIVEGSKDPDTVVLWKDAVERGVPNAPWLVKTGIDWGELMSRIWQWLKDNWPTILRLLLSIIVFLEMGPKRKLKKEREDVDSQSS